MEKRFILFVFYFSLTFSPLFWIETEIFAQISLNNSCFPLAGTEYNRFICLGGSVGSPGTGQVYDFSNAMVWANDTFRYISPAATGFAAFHPGSSVATVQWGDVSIIWYYSADSSAFWVSGGTLIGDFGQGMTAVHANHPAPYVDTLVSNEYTYGHTETEISGIRFQNLSPGIDYQTVSGKYITADGWGSLYAPLDTFPDVLRVKYIEFKFDTIFANNVPVDYTADTLYYYKYFAQGKRHPVAIAHTDTLDQAQWLEIIHFPDTLFGCTDTSAENYNPLANQENGTCIYCNQVNYTISPDTSVCAGDSIVLAASGGTNYWWSTGDSVSLVTVSPDYSETYSVYLSNQSYCWQMATVDVTVFENVQAGFWADLANPSDGDTILFVNTSVNATAYYWDFGDSTFSSEKNPRHLFTSEGTKNVMLIATNECSSDTFYMVITIVGGNELPFIDNKLHVYPNPNNGKFRVQATSHPELANCELKAYNILGKIVYSAEIKESYYDVDLSKEPDGIYFIQLQSGNFLLNKKIIKQ